MLTDDDCRVLAQLEIAKPCETLVEDCPERAVWMIWVDHHRQGCGITGFRCEWHFNKLILEANRMVAGIGKGIWTNCGTCGELLSSQIVSDYVRGIRL